jgi:hypothetical protein
MIGGERQRENISPDDQRLSQPLAVPCEAAQAAAVTSRAIGFRQTTIGRISIGGTNHDDLDDTADHSMAV